MKFDGIPYVGINNEDGMRDLVEHLIVEHKVKEVVYIGGSGTTEVAFHFALLLALSLGLTLGSHRCKPCWLSKLDSVGLISQVHV